MAHRPIARKSTHPHHHATLTVFEVAEREDVLTYDVFSFAAKHFSLFYDFPREEDYEEYQQGGPVPPYVRRLLEYQAKSRLV